jgi:hypothetical protein
MQSDVPDEILAAESLDPMGRIRCLILLPERSRPGAIGELHEKLPAGGRRGAAIVPMDILRDMLRY